MENLEQKLNEGLEQIKSQVKGAADANAEAVNEMKSKLSDFAKEVEEAKNAGIDKETIAKMQEHLDILDVKLQKKSGTTETKSIAGQLEAKMQDETIKSAIASLKGNRSASANIELKAVGTMLLANYGGTTLTEYVDRNISGAPKRQPLLRDIVNSFSITGNKVVWVNKVAGEGGAGMTAEGALKSQMDIDFTEESMDVKKITAYVKVSKEALDDLPFLRNEINTELVEAISLKLDDQLASGTGATVNLKGILTYAPTFTVTSTPFATSVANANKQDVLRVAVALIANERFTANAIVVNPLDAASIDLQKGTDGHYVMPPFVTADGVRIAGVRVIESQSITAGTFLVGDFTKSNLAIREELNINVGYENDDFTKNLVTILAEMRAAHYIKSHHVKAFVQGTFATAITAINKGV